MTLHLVWAQTFPTWFNEELPNDFGSTSHRVEYHLVIPDHTRIVKLVCSAGFTVRGASLEDLSVLGLTMAWNHHVVSEEIGDIVRLNEQAGELVMAQTVQPRWDLVAGGSDVPFTEVPQQVVTSYSGHIQPIDQKMAYGAVGVGMGARSIFGRFDFLGVHGVNGGSDPPWYTFGGAACMRILYEMDY